MTFSVIIPAYNNTEFLEDCINSVCEQDFPISDFEVLVIDDCSPDNLQDIVQRQQIIYPNLYYFRHKKNKRQGGARNTGIHLAKGEWIFFLDSDDVWLYHDVLQTFSKLIEENPSIDIFQSTTYKSIKKNTPRSLSRSNYTDFHTISYSGSEYMKSTYMRFMVWLSAYKLSFLRNNGLHFEENVRFEDTDFRIRASYYCRNILCFFFPFYGYRENSQSTTRLPDKNVFLDNIRSLCRCYNFIAKETKNQTMSKDIKLTYLDFIKRSILSFPKMSRHYSITDSMCCFHFLRESKLLAVNRYNTTLKERVLFQIMGYCPLILLIPIRILMLAKKRIKNKHSS